MINDESAHTKIKILQKLTVYLIKCGRVDNDKLRVLITLKKRIFIILIYK